MKSHVIGTKLISDAKHRHLDRYNDC
jgi:hypothetical protein